MAFKHAMINYDKATQRLLTTKTTQQQDQLADHRRLLATSHHPQRTHSQPSTTVNTAKDRNYVFQQIMKIEKMNKDIERRGREKAQELKNKDV